MEKIVVKVEVLGTLEKVWDAFTNPEHIVHWNFAGDDWHCPIATNDLKVGGEFHYQMAAKDGSFGFDFTGIYDVVEPMKHFQYHLADARVILVDFEEINGAIQVTETFDPETENPVEMQQMGWQMILNNFKKHAESI